MMATTNCHAKPERWKVHLGAHKTATTHVQRVLDSIAGDLRAQGIALLPQAIGRPAFRAAVRPHAGLRGIRQALDMRRRHLPAIRDSVAGARCAVVSDEDILGFTQNLMEPRFYPNLSGLNLIDRLSQRAELDIYLSIRNYPSILQSAFFEILKFLPDARQQMDNGLRAIQAGDSGWPDLMDRIARRLPRARLHFWRQEAYARSQCAILSGFLGTPLSQLPEIERPRKTASPSMRAIDEVQERAPREVSQQRARIVEDIYRRVPREAGETITLISPDVAEKLNAQYQADLALLRARYKEIGQDE